MKIRIDECENLSFTRHSHGESAQKAVQRPVTPILIEFLQEGTSGGLAPSSHTTSLHISQNFPTYRFRVPILRVDTTLLKVSWADSNLAPQESSCQSVKVLTSYIKLCFQWFDILLKILNLRAYACHRKLLGVPSVACVP